MRIQSTFRLVLAVIVAVFMMNFLISCGQGAPEGEDIAPEDVAVDEDVIGNDDSVDDGVELGKAVEIVNLTVNGVDVLLSGFDSEYTVDEEINLSATVRVGDTDVPWSGVLYLMIDHEGDVLTENEFVLDLSSAGDYSQDFSFTPTELGFHTLQGAIFAGYYEDMLGYYTAEFNVVGASSSTIEDLDLASDCSHGRFNLAGVEVILIDSDCDGLLEQYACGGGELVDIAHGATVLDCGLRISNGTTGNDRKDFRYADRSASVTAIPTIFAGGPGGDYIAGSSADDLILGGFENDNLQGREGNDTIACGSGNDYSKSEAGDDKIFGGEENDRIKGGTGHDELHGGPGDDYVDGQEGDDLLFGDNGVDFVYGSSGNDRVNCGDGDDECKGGSGMDTIQGDAGVDYCQSGSGNDFIDCGSGADTIDADRGDDVVASCDEEVDTITGGGGINTCTVDTGTDTTAYCTTIIACP